MRRVDQELAYVLHLKPYRENSAIVEFLTEHHGRVALVVNGLRGKTSPKRALLQPGMALCITFQINTTLGNLKQLESRTQKPFPLRHYFSLQYAHELILKVLHSDMPSTLIFTAYQSMLLYFHDNLPHQAIRHIELAILDAYLSLPDLTQCDGDAISPTAYYTVHPEAGLNKTTHSEAYTGQQVLAFNACLTSEMNEVVAQLAKPLTQAFLSLLVDSDTMKTKKIHQSLVQLQS